MKTLYVVAALAAGSLGFAQQTVSLENFKSVSIAPDMELTLVKSKENKLVIEGTDDQEIDIEQEKGNLTLKGEGRATLYYKGELENIAVGADGKVYSDDEITGASFSIAAGSDSKITLKLNVKKLHIAAGSDAQITLTGKAGDHNVTLASDAKLNAEELSTLNTSIVLASDAQATITTTGNLSATVGSDGELEIHGNPKNVKETKGSDAEIRFVR